MRKLKVGELVDQLEKTNNPDTKRLGMAFTAFRLNAEGRNDVDDWPARRLAIAAVLGISEDAVERSMDELIRLGIFHEVVRA